MRLLQFALLLLVGTVLAVQAHSPSDIPTIAALKAIPVTPSAHFIAMVSGYYAANDGGGGMFVYNANSSAAANGGTVIAPNSGAGRWIRSYSGALNVKMFGAYGDKSHDDANAIQATLNVTGLVFVPTATYKITKPISVPSYTTLQFGPGATLIQVTKSTGCLVIDSVTGASVWGGVIEPNSGPGIYVDNSFADCTDFTLRDNFIVGLGASGVGIDIAGTSARHNIGFGYISNPHVWGSIGTHYGKTIGIRFGGAPTTGQANGVTISGGRVWNVNEGLNFGNCTAVVITGISLDDMQGPSSIAVHFAGGAGRNEIFGIRWENGTYTKTVQFDQDSSDNFIYPMQAATTSSLWTDAGTRNSWLGGDGTGGLSNRLPNPIDYMGPQNYSGSINGMAAGILSWQSPQASAPINDTKVPNWNMGGTNNGTGRGGSTITHRFLFPFNSTSFPQVYLASCSYVSTYDSNNYTTRVSIVTETVSGTFVESNLIYAHPKSAILTFGFTRSGNDVMFAETAISHDRGAAKTTRNLIRLH